MHAFLITTLLFFSFTLLDTASLLHAITVTTNSSSIIKSGTSLSYEKKITDLNEQIFKRKTLNSCFILICHNQETLYSYNRYIDENSMMPLNSLTKLFTAMGIMTLVEQGKISIDDPLSKFKSKCFSANTANIKIFNLLSHTSGLSRRGVRAINSTDPFYYSNINFSILSEVIAKSTGISYHDFMLENIFQPLKMDHTTARQGYCGDSGISSTVADLKNAGLMFVQNGTFDGKIFLSEKSITRMLQPPSHLSIQSNMDYYGFGVWVRRRDNKLFSFYHRGRWSDSFSAIYVFPEKNIFIVILEKPFNYRSDSFVQYTHYLENLANDYVCSLTLSQETNRISKTNSLRKKSPSKSPPLKDIK